MTISVTQIPLGPDAAPQAGILLSNYDPVVASVVTVQVSWDDGFTWHNLRGGRELEFQDAAFIRDYVPPLNVTARYRVLLISGPGAESSVVYEWTGTTDNSSSTATDENDVLLRTNYARNPMPRGSVSTNAVTNFADYTPGTTGVGATTLVVEDEDGPIVNGRRIGYARRTVSTAKTTGTSGWFATGSSFRVTLAGTSASRVTVSAWVRINAASDPGAVHRSVQVMGGGYLSGSSVNSTTTSAIELALGEWTRVSVTYVPTGNFDQVAWSVSQASGSILPVGATFDIAGLLIESGTEVLDWFFGDTLPAPSIDEDTLLIEDERIWMQDPLNPRTAISLMADCSVPGQVFLAAGSLRQATWGQASDLVTPMDSEFPVASIGRRMQVSQIPLNFAYKVAEENGAFQRLLRTAGQIVLRGLPNSLAPAVAHLDMGSGTERRLSKGKHEVSTWNFQATTTRPLAIRAFIPWWSYDQVQALYSPDDYDTVVATRPGATYIDWQQDPSPQ